MTYQIKYKIYLSSMWEAPYLKIKYKVAGSRFWKLLTVEPVHTYGYTHNFGAWQCEDFRREYFDDAAMNLEALIDLLETDFDNDINKYVKAVALSELRDMYEEDRLKLSAKEIGLSLLTKGWQYQTVEIKEDNHNGKQAD